MSERVLLNIYILVEGEVRRFLHGDGTRGFFAQKIMNVMWYLFATVLLLVATFIAIV